MPYRAKSRYRAARIRKPGDSAAAGSKRASQRDHFGRRQVQRVMKIY